MGSYSSLLKLKPYIKKCKYWLLVGIVGMIICSVIYMPIPYLMGYIIDKILLQHKSHFELYNYTALLALLYILRYGIAIFSKKLFIKVDKLVVNEIRVSMMDKIIDLPMSFLAKKEKGYILSRISECDSIGMLFSPMFVNTFLSIFDLIFAIIMMVALNYKLTIIILIMVPIYFFTVKTSSKKLSESTKLMLETGAVLSGETFEVLNGIEEIKILNGKMFQLKKFKTKLEELVKNSIKQSKQILFFMENITIVNNLATLVVLLFSGVMILNGNLTIGIYTAFVTYMSKVFGSTTSFSSLSMTLKPVCVNIERIYEFLELDNENMGRTEVLKEPINTIIIDKIGFKYDKDGPDIINNLSCTINKGDKLFIKGENGSGKSTLIKILLGLYDAQEGEIIINGSKYSTLNKNSIRKKIGIVSQNIFLFKGTVLENILYGQVNKDKSHVVSLIKEYKLEKYMDSFENGLESVINQNGSGISGGQTQIIAFLRANITRKDIIILDEGTSNMDTETRESILKILGEKDIADIIMVISHQEEGLDFINKTLYLGSDK